MRRKPLSVLDGGYKSHIISTIVDMSCSVFALSGGYKSHIISTIVDSEIAWLSKQK